jgi:glycosyltransferase involved in cell wall biosynthesis
MLKGRPAMGYVRRPQRHHGRGVGQVPPRQPDARLLLVGSGPSEAALKTQAQASPAIRFVGRVPHHEVKRYLCAARDHGLSAQEEPADRPR